MKLKLVGDVEVGEQTLKVRVTQDEDGDILVEAGREEAYDWSILSLKVGNDGKMFLEVHCAVDDPRIRTDGDGCIEVERDVD